MKNKSNGRIRMFEINLLRHHSLQFLCKYDSMKISPSWEAVSWTATQEFPKLHGIMKKKEEKIMQKQQ
jgi:hypothetical protein